MCTDALRDSIAQRLIDYFNASLTAPLEELGHRTLAVHCAILARSQSSNSIGPRSLTALVTACHGMFPGIRFRCEDSRSSSDEILLVWRGEFRRDDQGAQVVNVPCTCRVRVRDEQISEIWFVIDSYSVLLQLGRICAEPGQSNGRSAVLNRLAMDSLRDAIVTRRTLDGALGPGTFIHASVKIFKDINHGVETETFTIEGVGKIHEMLGHIRERFTNPIDLSISYGLSQGYTTTFRGSVSAVVGAEMQRYDIFCGFVSPADQVVECWVKIAPPPTVKECLL